MKIGGRGRRSTRKDTDQVKELAAKKESADTKRAKHEERARREERSRRDSSKKEKERMLRYDKNKYDEQT